MELRWIDGDRVPVITDVYSGAILEHDGNQVGFCFRDDTVEFNVMPKAGGSRWFRIDMQELDVHPLQRRK